MIGDFDLQRNIMAELRWDPSINAAAIGVAVKDGIVTLTGNVDTYAQKVAAERTVQRVAGVYAVADELEVRIGGDLRRSDEDIARAAANALAWNTEVPNNVSAVVRAGWLTLSGTVEWYFQKVAAERVVRFLAGVRGVTDLLLVEHPARAEPARIKADIEAALRRSAELDAGRIHVEAHGDVVVLKGTVRSWAEREDATRAAWNAPGVTMVDDELTLLH
jgi:osmotically-inducible protein OsmY